MATPDRPLSASLECPDGPQGRGAQSAVPSASTRRPAPSLGARALGFLARREHTRQELRRKLARHADTAFPQDPEAAAAALEAVLDRLQALGYLDEARAAEAVVRQQAASQGVTRLRQTLQQRGVAAEQVQAALETLESSELERARALWQRRFAGHLPQTRAEWARQARFLTGRGFASDVVRQVLPSMPSDPPLAGRASWSRSGRGERMAAASEEAAAADAQDDDGWTRSSRQRQTAPARSSWGQRTELRRKRPPAPEE